jgi:RimJ/RimL family protein N-acetyltransferase
MPNPKIIIETERLKILPLNLGQLEKYLINDHSLEEELSLKKSIRHISDELKEAMSLTIIPTILKKPEDYIYSTLWIVVEKESKQIIAEITYMSITDSDGEIEIGYGTDEEYRNKGYMTEAIGGMIKWSGTQTGIKIIIASTEKGNKASHIVLVKNKFIKFNETNSMICWKFDLNKARKYVNEITFQRS